MGAAIGQMLTSAVGVAMSPIPLIAIVLMLATPRGRGNGIAFTSGWVLSIAVITVVVVLAGGRAGAHQQGTPAAWVPWVKLVLGVLFVVLGARQWRGRPKDGREPALPGWMQAIDAFTPIKAAGLAVVLSAANPKNLVLAVGGAVSIAGGTASVTAELVAGVLFVLIASLCTAVPLAVYLAGGRRSAAVLQSWKTWMAAHNSAIMTVLLLVLGVKYVGDALGGLSA